MQPGLACRAHLVYAFGVTGLRTSRETADAVVIGAGVAGLSGAWALAERGLAVHVLEREPVPAAHASGRNAAMFHAALPDAVHVPLARETRALYRSGALGEGLLDETGSIARLPDEATATALLSALAEADLPAQTVTPDEAARRLGGFSAPALAGGPLLHCPTDGVLDVHAIILGLCEALRALGARVTFGRPVRALHRDGARVVGVHTDAGTIPAAAVVNAAGAWARGLGGGHLPLSSPARHLAWLRATIDPRTPLFWDVARGVYLRPDGGGLLASPCDDVDAIAPGGRFDAAVQLAERMGGLSPAIDRAELVRLWPCRRTFAPDARFVAGPDPLAQGLYWLTGLGGRGMTAAPAAARLLAGALVDGTPLPAEMLPGRLLHKY